MDKWWRQYASTARISEEDEIFLSYFKVNEFDKILPPDFILNKHTKTTVTEYLEIVKRWIDTGILSYYSNTEPKEYKPPKEFIWRN